MEPKKIMNTQSYSRSIRAITISTLVCGVALITGCQQKTKAEAAKVEAAKVEAAKAEAVENQRRQSIEGVLSFLKSEKFLVTLKWQDDSQERENRFQYDDFLYDEQERSLVFQCRSYTSADSIEYPQVGHAISELQDIKIDLPTAIPVVKIAYFEPFFYKLNSQLPAKKVSIRAKCANRSMDKNGGDGKDARSPSMAPLVRSVGALLTKEDREKLNTQPWSEFKEQEVEFVVSEDIAPRLKTALEDLLKAHDVKVSKY